MELRQTLLLSTPRRVTTNFGWFRKLTRTTFGQTLLAMTFVLRSSHHIPCCTGCEEAASLRCLLQKFLNLTPYYSSLILQEYLQIFTNLEWFHWSLKSMVSHTVSNSTRTHTHINKFIYTVYKQFSPLYLSICFHQVFRDVHVRGWPRRLRKPRVVWSVYWTVWNLVSSQEFAVQCWCGLLVPFRLWNAPWY